MSNIKAGYKVDEMITELVKKKIIVSVIKGDIVLDYVNKISLGDEVYEIIKDFDNVGWVFDYYKGVNNIGKCQICGQMIQLKGKYKLYCVTCAKEKQFIQKKEWDKNKRIRKV